MTAREYNFDGLVGPTHNYGGLSFGNVASGAHGGQVSSPRAAALQGLAKMKAVHAMGVGQAVLPPLPRPSLTALRALGFHGRDEDVIAQAAQGDGALLRLCSSASSMWTANAATVAPSSDARDGRVHATPANLHAMFHRAIEADETRAVLERIFADTARFTVHAPLPGGGQFGDEGAANHTRLYTPGHAAVHVFAWGRRAFAVPGESVRAPVKFPARQCREASEAVARLHQLDPSRVLFVQQDPDGIDAGAFHTDVLAVGHAGLLLYHARAFVDDTELVRALRERLGDAFTAVRVSEDALSVETAVKSYLFNSQLVTSSDGATHLIAPEECVENPRVRALLDGWVSDPHVPLQSVRFFDLRQSMHNGGGPACLRQRVVLTDAERDALGARVVFTESLHDELVAWVTRHYRERLAPDDLRDPMLARESMRALDELTNILGLGSVYDFQRSR